MNHHKDDFDPQIITQLEQLRETPPRNSHAAAATRAAFLAEVRNAAQSVPPRPLQRLNQWMAAIITFLAAPGKERGVPMFNAVLSLIVVLGLTFGGGTVAAAQTSMPDDALYQVKLWSENARISIASSQEAQLQLALKFAARRMEEIQTMLQTGQTPPETVMTRLQNQLENAMSLAVNMPDEQVQTSILQVQTQLQQHDQTMIQLQLHQNADPTLLQVRDRVRTMLQEQLHLCQSGLLDPEQLREQLRIQEQDRLQQQLQDGSQNQNQEGEQNQNQEGGLNQYQYQNQESDSDQSQDQEGSLNQYQYQNQYQNGTNNSIPTVDPTEPPTSGNGPGDGTCPNCPSGDCDCDGSGQNNSGGNGGKP